MVRNWLIGAVAVAGLVALFWSTARGPQTGAVRAGLQAPAFSLPSTDGRTVTLASLAGRNTLLYFNEGVGCDPCFTQMVELQQQQAQLDRLGITLIPVMTNSAAMVAQEMQRFRLGYPALIDASKSVSGAYGTLGTGHHADQPGHSFILIDKAGAIRWRGDYPGMYVSAGELLTKLQDALGA